MHRFPGSLYNDLSSLQRTEQNPANQPWGISSCVRVLSSWGGVCVWGLSQKNLAPAKGRAERGLGLSKSHSLAGTQYCRERGLLGLRRCPLL